MEGEIKLTESQKKRFEKIWFIYGNYGKKCTTLNHKLVQGFYQYGENRIEAYRQGYENMLERHGKEYADVHGVTQECIDACMEILNNPE